ncbi:hypothetical protein BVG16_25310 [Paenibacillus selenitireducens]|uniref:Uncharacterized protein n=2 Tax=Paenibacillus selenitireducens TaxID=1324314 RepID=A0A1T2X2F2_9BACL|nr:hypothetical protein BVG16_25310 [Paenibacillus selenitireducens]
MNYQDIQWIFSGIGVAIFAAIKITNIINPFSIITNSKEEILFSNNINKISNKIFLFFFTIIFLTIYFTVFSNIDLKEDSSNFLLKVFISWWSLGVMLVLLLFFNILIFSKKIREFIFKKIYFEMRYNKNRSLFYVIPMLLLLLLYFVIVSMMYGNSINLIIITIANNNKITSSTSLGQLYYLPLREILYIVSLSLLVALVYSLFLFPLLRLLKLISSSKLILNIHMNDGTIYKDKFILNNNLDGFLLVSDVPYKEAVDKQMLPRNNIKEIQSRTITTVFGYEAKKSDLILPKDFTDEEKRLYNNIKK